MFQIDISFHPIHILFCFRIAVMSVLPLLHCLSFV